MSIKDRLRLSYLAMLVIPIILTLVVSGLAGRYYTGDMLKSLGGEYPINPLNDALTERNRLFAEIKQTSLLNPEKLVDKDFLSRLEERFIIFDSGVIIRREKEIIYSSPMLEGFNYEEYLPKFGEYMEDIMVPLHGKHKELLINQHDFYFSDHTKGTLFWVMNIKPLKRAFQQITATMTIFVMGILFLTNVALTYLVSGSIIRPLNRLKASAYEIKEGNLDFQIKDDSKDEIGELNRAFEEMRARLKHSLDKQIQYENNRKELISNISHDLKTPITSIKGYIEGIRDGVADTPEKMEKYINTIYNKAVDIDRLIDELFLYSKLDLNRLPLNLTPISLGKYLEDIIEELRFDLEKQQLLIDYIHPEESVEVMADGKQLKRVMVNIIENAVKYMDKPNGRVMVRLDVEGDEVIVAVKDNGMGIPEDALPFIFDRFYRTDPSRNKQTGGSGLGLAIAKRIIEEHGGQMKAESVLGEGTTIYFTLKKR